MLHLSTDQLTLWITTFFWPMIRILALFNTAPLLSERSIPQRAKIGLGLMMTFLIAPNLPPTDVPLFSSMGFWLAIQQVMIGAALGMTMQLAFAAVRMAGEIMGLQMGISFATFFDTSNRLNSPVLAQVLNMLAVLLFLSFNGHLWMISLLADSFQVLPIRAEPLNGNGFLALAQSGSMIFSSGLMLAMPIITLLLTINLSLGLLNRVTPQLSVFVIGFPITLTVGILSISLMMPLMAPFCERLFSEVLFRLTTIVGDIAG